MLRKSAVVVHAEYIVEGGFKGRKLDKEQAKKANVTLPPSCVWHHNKDGKTLQAIDQDIHQAFTHYGGISLLGLF